MSERCRAKRTNGEPCRAYPIHGADVCRTHGGSAPQVKAAAKRRLAEEAARIEAAKYIPNLADVGQLEDPLGELLRVAAQMVAFKDALAERVSQMSAEDWRYESSQRLEQVRAEVSLLQSAMRDVAKIIESMAKLDLEARRTRLAERHADALVGFIRGVLGDLDLTAEQWAVANAVVPARLAELDGSEPAGPYTGRSTPAALPRAR
jgi:hypothetical protein